MPLSAGLAGASAITDMASGILGFFSAGYEADVYKSRANMLRMEAEANAQRYEESSRAFLGQQITTYAKSGVRVGGSALDVLDETIRVSAANASAIRAGGAAAALDMENKAAQAEVGGRASLLSGIAGGAVNLGKAAYWSDRNTGFGMPRNNQGAVNGYSWAGEGF